MMTFLSVSLLVLKFAFGTAVPVIFKASVQVVVWVFQVVKAHQAAILAIVIQVGTWIFKLDEAALPYAHGAVTFLLGSIVTHLTLPILEDYPLQLVEIFDEGFSDFKEGLIDVTADIVGLFDHTKTPVVEPVKPIAPAVPILPTPAAPLKPIPPIVEPTTTI